MSFLPERDVRHGLITAIMDSEWELLKHEFIHFDEIAKEYGDLDEYKCGDMAIMTSLRNKQTGREVIAVNVHLYWNPTHDYVKLAQAIHLLEKCATFYRKNDNSDDDL